MTIISNLSLNVKTITPPWLDAHRRAYSTPEELEVVINRLQAKLDNLSSVRYPNEIDLYLRDSTALILADLEKLLADDYRRDRAPDPAQRNQWESRIERIKDHADILDVVERYVKLTRSGKRQKSLCPFHREKTPSFYVFPDDGHAHCFGCGWHGDVIDFVQTIDQSTLSDAMDKLESWHSLAEAKTCKSSYHPVRPQTRVVERREPVRPQTREAIGGAK